MLKILLHKTFVYLPLKSIVPTSILHFVPCFLNRIAVSRKRNVALCAPYLSLHIGGKIRTGINYIRTDGNFHGNPSVFRCTEYNVFISRGRVHREHAIHISQP